MLEDDRLRMGGDYLLALVKSDTGYDILYMGGAVKIRHHGLPAY